MKLLLEKSAEHLEKGLQMERAGNVKTARYHIYKAAEFLFQAAQKSPPELKEKRIERAEGLIKRAKGMPEKLGVSATGGGSEQETSEPSWMISEKPSVLLSDVAGLDDVKEEIRLRLIYPFTHPELAARFGIKTGGGILLFGPPGTGKTMLARAVAGEIDAAFFPIRPSQIMSKWVGEAEQNIAKLFQQAKAFPRSVIFIDEVESLIPKRSGSGSTVMQRVVPQLLAEMEGFSSDRSSDTALLFLGATNEPWALDPAVLRPGRFDEKVFVPLPDQAARLKILETNLDGKPLDKDLDFAEIAWKLESYSGADIRRVCEKACDIPFIESVISGTVRDVTSPDISQAIQYVKPSVTKQAIIKLQKFMGGDEIDR